MNILLLILIISVLIIPAQADPLSDALGGAVTRGIDDFFGMAGNAIMGGNSTSGFSSLSEFYDPTTNPVVVDSIKNTSIFGFTIYIAYVLLAMAYLVLQSKKPEVVRTAEYILNTGKSYDLPAFVKKCSLIIVLFLFILIIMYTVLQMAQAFTNMMDTSSMSVIQTSQQSGFMTFIYSIFWLVIKIFLELRNLIITFIYCFIVILIMLWGFSFFEKPIEILGIYFLILAFMQPVMVGMAAIGIKSIEFTNQTQGGAVGVVTNISASLAMLVILIAVAVLFIVGPIYFHKQFFSMRGN